MYMIKLFFKGVFTLNAKQIFACCICTVPLLGSGSAKALTYSYSIFVCFVCHLHVTAQIHTDMKTIKENYERAV